MIKMLQETQKQLKDDLPRIMAYANKNDELNQMCRNCENWCGKEHDYSECLDKPCFTFYRAFKYLDFANGWHEGER
jgi:hypothetical protein